ncbi:hypothetical protein [Paenirhodobacter populi]|uniref:PepSY domain-containing protein n=1 Tax=Paenirhodobacter populi TaxID=2306993 RepID=A0A443JT97_9RHOB|nr:hypothetical protein [Sinirhodobacter populi]RWR23713.1 hypothetical protein D2T30_04510 [Sinirhodobacter populi]
MKQAILTAALLIALALPVAAQQVPAVLDPLGLSDVQVRDKKHSDYGRVILGTLPGGARIAVELDREGRVEEIEGRRGDRFPVSAVAPLIPEAVRANPSWPADAVLEKLDFDHHDRIEIEGRLADGREFDAEFARDGRLIDFDTDD